MTFATAMPRVSVITPAYNVERYIADTMWSVLHQSYSDLEIVVADDGSTDATLAVARAIARSDPDRVQVLARPNGGPSAARNAAIAAARGEFLALVDSDDIWEREFLERQMAILAARPDVDLVTGNGRYLGSLRHGQPVRPYPDRRPPVSLETIIADEEAVYVMTVFRRRVYDTIGGFDETLRGSEDFEFWLRAALAGFRFARNDEPLSWYRRRDHSLSTDSITMLTGALTVCRRTRPACADRPEREVLERKIEYYAAELDAAQARHALRTGNAGEAARALRSLQARRPSLRHAIAAALAGRAGRVLSAMYQIKRAVQA